MKGFFARLLITALGLWAASAIVPGFRVDGVADLVVASLLLGIANAIVRPIVFVLTLPLTILTLGLFLLVINAAMVVSVTGWFASSFVGGSGRIERFRRIEVRGRTLD